MAPNAEFASDWISLAALLALLLVVMAMVALSRLPSSIKLLIYLGVGLRVVGAAVRYRVLWDFYNGMGDARGYYGKGIQYAELFYQLDFSPFKTLITAGNHLGTAFVRLVSGIVVTFIGQAMFTEFVVFSLFAFVGLIGFAVAFHHSYPSARITGYLALVWLFPSLWYWPSSVGKEAVIVMGLGLAVMGFIGKRSRINWPLLALGTAIVYAVRPELAGVLLFSMILAQWLSFRGGWTAGRVVQGVVLLVVGLVGISYSMQTVGIDQFDVEGVMSYAEADVSRKATGGTSVEAVSVGIKGVPKAAFNVLLRPMPWESTNVMVLLSSIEILAVWGLVAWRRKEVVRSLRNWRSDKFLSLAIVFILLYSVALGMMLVNLGIIARQRIFLFPFIFLLLEARPGAAAPEAKPRPRFSPAIARARRVSAGAPV